MMHSPPTRNRCAATTAAAPLACLQAEVPLLTPDILVCSVGTAILINGEEAAADAAGGCLQGD